MPRNLTPDEQAGLVRLLERMISIPEEHFHGWGTLTVRLTKAQCEGLAKVLADVLESNHATQS